MENITIGTEISFSASLDFGYIYSVYEKAVEYGVAKGTTLSGKYILECAALWKIKTTDVFVRLPSTHKYKTQLYNYIAGVKTDPIEMGLGDIMTCALCSTSVNFIGNSCKSDAGASAIGVRNLMLGYVTALILTKLSQQKNASDIPFSEMVTMLLIEVIEMSDSIRKHTAFLLSLPKEELIGKMKDISGDSLNIKKSPMADLIANIMKGHNN